MTTKTFEADVIILLVLMAGAWGLLAFDLWGIVSTPALSGEARYSRGWQMIWGFGLVLATCGLMGLLLWRLHVPGGWLVALVSAAGALCAIQLMDEGTSPWPAAIPLLLPLVITAAAFTSYWAQARVALIVISLVPSVMLGSSTAMAAMAKSRERNAIDEETRTKNLAIVKTISEDEPLRTWLPQLREKSGVRKEALAAVRTLKRRQADIEQMLANRTGDGVDLVPELNLQVTPRLQQLLNAQSASDAEYARTMPGGGDEILERTFIYASLPAMHWLHDHGGDCREGISALKAAVLLYRDTPIRKKLINELDALLK